MIERAVTLSDGELLDVEDLGLEDDRPLAAAVDFPVEPLLGVEGDHTLNLDVVTQRLVVTALKKTRGHKGRAASLLGIHPRTLTRMMRRYGIAEAVEESSVL